jgi:hypothetical protein
MKNALIHRVPAGFAIVPPTTRNVVHVGSIIEGNKATTSERSKLDEIVTNFSA